MKYDFKNRREALGLSQEELAVLVRQKAGTKFSQQAYQKLEAKPNAKSRFLHFIIEVFKDLEGSTLVDEVREFEEIYQQLPNDQLKRHLMNQVRSYRDFSGSAVEHNSKPEDDPPEKEG